MNYRNDHVSPRWRFKIIIACIAGVAFVFDLLGSFNHAKNLMSFRSLTSMDMEYNSVDMNFPMADTRFDEAMFHSQNGPPPEKRSGPGDDTVFLLGIFSTLKDVEESEARQRIRDTYLSYKNDPRICSLKNYMMWKDAEAAKVQTENTGDEASSSSICKILYTFVIGGNENTEESHYRLNEDRPITINAEDIEKAEEDSVYLNIKENISHNKTLAWFKYASEIAESYGIDYISKLDSDTMVSIPHLMDYIITDLPPNPYAVRVYGGSLYNHHPSTKTGNLYAAGQFVFMSVDLADFVSSDDIDRASIAQGYRSPAKAFEEEDVDVGTIVWSHPYPIKGIFMNQRIVWIHRLKTADEWMGLWEETGGVLPLTRVIGKTEMTVKPGDWTEYLKTQGLESEEN